MSFAIDLADQCFPVFLLLLVVGAVLVVVSHGAKISSRKTGNLVGIWVVFLTAIS